MTREELMREIERGVVEYLDSLPYGLIEHYTDGLKSGFESGALFLADRLIKAEQERDQLRAGILEKDELIKEGLAVDAGLRARIGNLREALEKCREHVQLDDPNWGSLTALAFASRCGLVEIEANQALAADKEQT